MRSFGVIVVVVACLVASTVLLYRFFCPLPALEDLRKYENIVVADKFLMKSKKQDSPPSFPVFRFDGKNGNYKYPVWFPRPGKIYNAVKIGDTITIWSDVGDNYWIWQLKRGGDTLVSYNDVVSAIRSRHRPDLILGFALMGMGIFGIYRLLGKKYNETTAEEKEELFLENKKNPWVGYFGLICMVCFLMAIVLNVILQGRIGITERYLSIMFIHWFGFFSGFVSILISPPSLKKIKNNIILTMIFNCVSGTLFFYRYINFP